MPIGSYVAPTTIITQLVNSRPKSVLDLGVGFGFYGVSVRNFLDYGVKPFKTWLAGIEGFESYRNPCWDVYDKIEIGRIQDIDFLSLLPPSKEKWACIMMSDVLEHFEKEEGIAQIDRAKSALARGGILIISTPGRFGPQGAAHGNVLERHRSLFISKDLEPLGFTTLRKEGMQSDGRNTVISVFRNG